MTIDLQARLLEWARLRARLTEEALADKMEEPVENVMEWEASGKLTFQQAEKLAQVTRTALGYLFLLEPPDENHPVPDQPDAQTAMLCALEEQAEEAAERLQKYLTALTPAAETGTTDVREMRETCPQRQIEV